jgi:hypothetical protein
MRARLRAASATQGGVAAWTHTGICTALRVQPLARAARAGAHAHARRELRPPARLHTAQKMNTPSRQSSSRAINRMAQPAPAGGAPVAACGEVRNQRQALPSLGRSCRCMPRRPARIESKAVRQQQLAPGWLRAANARAPWRGARWPTARHACRARRRCPATRAQQKAGARRAPGSAAAA